ncbi:MAG: hypothetical protein ACP6IS_01115 [Candidatus Asgardarchaeia archaeon]
MQNLNEKSAHRRARIEFNKLALLVPIFLIIIGVLLLVVFYNSNLIISLIGGLLAFVGFFVLFFLSAVLGYFLTIGMELNKRRRRKVDG